MAHPPPSPRGEGEGEGGVRTMANENCTVHKLFFLKKTGLCLYLPE